MPISFRALLFQKKEFHGDHDALVSRMSRELGSYIRENLDEFLSFERIVVYYDNGQKEITTIINTVLNALLEAEVRRVRPSDYALFQAADMVCTLALLARKSEDGSLSKSELSFFGSRRDLIKNHLKPMERKGRLIG